MSFDNVKHIKDDRFYELFVGSCKKSYRASERRSSRSASEIGNVPLVKDVIELFKATLRNHFQTSQARFQLKAVCFRIEANR